MFKRKNSKLPRFHTLIGAQTRINGDVEIGGGGLHLDGRINGNVKAEQNSTATIVISEQGCIEGSVSVPTVVLNGLVKGDIEVGTRVELGPKARVLGNVHYVTIQTAVGAQINGKLIHRQPPAATDPATAGVAAEGPAAGATRKAP
ncbi:MAG TPA: polymer-forming cytoskeletal protein [Steroidobacteraceae bacterium]|nr:polymer-forming cytoskeletal protein [Steroidobacteraceae bacterium]